MNIIELDGSFGEGGGQILRSAMSLSMYTDRPIRIKNIRAKRSKPGLMRQHLTAVQAAAAISSAKVDGAEVGSCEISFFPGEIQGGEYLFSIGTAGSCTLVLQTLLPALLSAKEDSQITLRGGTHNSMSPPFHFLQRAFLPLLTKMGAKVEIQLNRFVFYPAGGGEIVMRIKSGNELKPLHLESRGKRISTYAEAFSAGLPTHVPERELDFVKQRMGWTDDQLLMRSLDPKHGPGNALLITLEHEHVTEVFTGFAERGVAAEAVANTAVKGVQRYASSEAAVGGFLADQLLLPMALAGGGSFIATDWSLHAATNAEIIRKFLSIDIETAKLSCGDVSVKLRR